MGQRRWRTREGGREEVTHIRSAVNSTDRTRIAGRRGRKEGERLCSIGILVLKNERDEQSGGDTRAFVCVRVSVCYM